MSTLTPTNTRLIHTYLYDTRIAFAYGFHAHKADVIICTLSAVFVGKLCVPGDKVRPHSVISDARAPPCGQHNGVLLQNIRFYCLKGYTIHWKLMQDYN